MSTTHLLSEGHIMPNVRVFYPESAVSATETRLVRVPVVDGALILSEWTPFPDHGDFCRCHVCK